MASKNLRTRPKTDAELLETMNKSLHGKHYPNKVARKLLKECWKRECNLEELPEEVRTFCEKEEDLGDGDDSSSRFQFRAKSFSTTDGYGGKGDDIVKNNKLIPARGYKPFGGEWVIEWGDEALIEAGNTKYFDKEDQRRIEEITDWIAHHPYSKDDNKYGQHPLFMFEDSKKEVTVWSADINKDDRLIYLIYKRFNKILIINCKGHKVIDEEY